MSLVNKELLDSLPTSPGIYILKEKSGKSIYIGKAINLRSRVRSYFTSTPEKNARPLIPYLVKEVHDIDYFVTKDEREALVLENSLIKQKKPRYNLRLKDDKNYSSLRLDTREKFPKLSFTRRILKDGALYFGPFTSSQAMKGTKRIIQRIFPIRDCSNEKFRRHSDRPCLNYYMKLCSGPCAGIIDEGRYNDIAEHAKLFLKGERKEIIRILKKNMERASDELRFEDAGHYRDQIKLLEKHLNTPLQITSSLTDKDIIGFHREENELEIVVLISRGGTIIDTLEYSFDKVVLETSEALQEFILQFYEKDRFIPREILVPTKFEDLDIVSELLSEKLEKKVSINIPERGFKKSLLELATKNAGESFKRKHREKEKGIHLLQKIMHSLGLTKLPESIECFDISNIQGTSAVASMVRFENAKPEKKKYKRFKIKTVFGPNDYASMYEVLSRRFKHTEEENWEFPDLILIDGGKGQLNIAHEVIKELGFENAVDLASIAKGREEGEFDKIYVPGRKNPATLGSSSRELFLLMNIRDEAHRFAITYHKNLRGKKALLSELDLIPGIGKSRRGKLLKHFGSLSGIREASVEEISSIPGLNEKVAKILKQYLTTGSL